MSIVYWCEFLFVLIFAYLAESNPCAHLDKNGRRIILPDTGAAVLLSLSLMLVAGFRYRVGTDYMAYFRWNPSDWDKVWNSLLCYKEGGFSLLVKLSRTVFDSGQSAIFVSAIITVGLFCWTIYKYHSMYLVSILLFIFTGVWQDSFNGIRQCFAAAVIFAGHRYILSRDYVKYCFIVFIAGMFHTTALIMVVPLFIFNRKADIAQLVILSIGAVVIRFSYDIIFSLIGSYKGTIMNVAGDSYLSYSVNIFRILVAFIPVVIYTVLCRKNDHTAEQDFYINALFFHAFSMVAGMGSTYFGRVGIYTGAAATIGYGYMFQLIDDEKTRKTTIYIALVMFFFYWMYSINAAGISNFRWIFNQVEG